MVDAAPAVQALAGFRNGTESSNPSRSTVQSEVQRNPPGLLWNLREMAANSAVLAFKPGRRKSCSQLLRPAFEPLSLEGRHAVRFHRHFLAEPMAEGKYF